MQKQSDVTSLLLDWRAGQKNALNDLLPLVQDNLRQLAASYMRGENAGHTLQATALVNEAFIKLVDVDITWQNRAHFIAIAANTMRRILVDHARAKRREKRGGDNIQVTLHETRIGKDEQADILELEDVLTKLEAFDQRKSQVIELSFYGGLTYDEIAEVLGISAATVDRELRFAKAWLYRELNDDNNS
ncbi:Gll4071 protein [hydrothermal vent metagenome]|uniref:Gll4071 protein n=1 Tax=hydrothermal vent metagenome TaxID=652676 RepID=A0A3B1AMD6_9ZZZZ